MKPPAHHDPEWFKIPQDIRDVPWNDAPYVQEIHVRGGIEAVADTLLGFVRPEILQLQGHPICRETLDEVRSMQDDDKDWDGNMGYMDYITDARHRNYKRCYVGQCTDGERRILRQHVQDILQKSRHNLHHFIVWMGNGQRNVNFIRLWACPESVTESGEASNRNWVKVRMNLLEALFCKAFFTHHGIMNRHEGNRLLQLKSFGLNLMTPLAQNGVKLDYDRLKFVHESDASPDPQIVFWGKFRSQQKSEAKRRRLRQLKATRQIFRCDFNLALQKALHDNVLFQELKESMTNVSGSSLGEYDSTEKFSDILLPWALERCKFDETNVLVWTFNFRAFSPINQNNLSNRFEDTRHRHQEILDTSNARIIILCGSRAEEALQFVPKIRYSLELRGFRFSIYIANSHISSGVSKRLFIVCPVLPARIWSNIRCNGAMISEAIRFATSMLELEGIRPYSVKTSSILGSILSWARMEKLGKEAVTLETMDFNVALWLSRKGIGFKCLEEIVKLSGNLPRALLMILYALRRQLQKPEWFTKRHLPFENQDEQLPPKKKLCNGALDMKCCKDVEKIVKKATDKIDEEYAQRLQSLVEKPSLIAGPHASQSPETDAQDISSDVDLLLGKQLPDSMILKKVHSEILLKNPKPMTPEEYKRDSELDTDIADLVPLCTEAIDLGILEPSLRRAKRTNREKKEGRIWKNQVNVFRDKEYYYRANPDIDQHRTIYVNYCPIELPRGEDIGDGTVQVKIEITPPGESHPQCYSTQATDMDPSCCLAFQVKYSPHNGPDITKYVTHSRLTSVWKANTFVDVLRGKPIEEIACTPRRYIYFWKDSRIPPGLEKFVGGGYTDGTPSGQ
ncbi:uncharacterized protein N7511_007526 [Penicillium nucicola]|uniref:uncharacterized protein n=1 Tax=Penicillium nucicola TaxID=1850975 RepID=UPI00254556D1|nr:uncharacterized protein N7511_007526 [Penicillium nucicola]KAJ5753373.1 hypothetical protein N7511_007526 [Penicillium nucicola]